MRAYILILLAGFLLTSGCSTLSGGSSASGTTATAPQEYYYDFDDILVPKMLELDSSRTFVMETPSMKSGVMVFEGNAERLSLTDFFITNMTRDNWSMRSAFKSNRTLLLFEKPTRYCVISISESTFNTLCEIWVLPKTGEAPNATGTVSTPTETILPGASNMDSIITPMEERPFPVNEQTLPQ